MQYLEQQSGLKRPRHLQQEEEQEESLDKDVPLEVSFPNSVEAKLLQLKTMLEQKKMNIEQELTKKALSNNQQHSNDFNDHHLSEIDVNNVVNLSDDYNDYPNNNNDAIDLNDYYEDDYSNEDDDDDSYYFVQEKRDTDYPIFEYEEEVMDEKPEEITGWVKPLAKL